VRIEVLNEGVDYFVGDERLATAIGGRLIPVDSKHAFEIVVGVCNRSHSVSEDLAKVGGGGENISPTAALGDRKAVLTVCPEKRLLLVREAPALLSFLLGNGLVRLVLPLVAEAFVEHQGQNVVFVVLTGSLAAQDVCRAPEMGLKLLLSESHGLSIW
jgi:hypothetical protein